jgi:hypothetical protein
MHRSSIEPARPNRLKLQPALGLSPSSSRRQFEKSAQKRARTRKNERAILKIDTQNGQKRTRPDLRLEDEIIDPSRTMAFHPL